MFSGPEFYEDSENHYEIFLRLHSFALEGGVNLSCHPVHHDYSNSRMVDNYIGLQCSMCKCRIVHFSKMQYSTAVYYRIAYAVAYST